jgi:L-amino acid N-acyltransferase YncA
MMTTLEAALDQDIEAIIAIYNEAIVDGSLATADLEPVSVEARRAAPCSRHEFTPSGPSCAATLLAIPWPGGRSPP